MIILEKEDIIVELKNRSLEENKEIREKTLKEANLVELYSDRTILVFSVLFSCLAGAILFYSNLKILKKEDGDKVIIFGVLYTIGIVIIGSIIPDESIRSFSYLLNILGGFIITIHYRNKLYPKNLEYKKKKSWKVFFITLLIVLGIGFMYV